MNILVTGAAGFVGKNLVCQLKNIRDLKDRTHPNLEIKNIYEYDITDDIYVLQGYCKDADFVFNFAGVNRPKDKKEFITGNSDFVTTMTDILKKNNNKCPIMLASSIQASLTGRFSDSEYGRSKREAEDKIFTYGQETGTRVLVYRFPNLFGKWCRPNYNSVVATFCNNIANDLPIVVNDAGTELELLYIDDLVNEMLEALENREHTMKIEDNNFCCVPGTYRSTLGEIEKLLRSFHEQPDTLVIPNIPKDSFAKKLYSTYLSYLPAEKIKIYLDMKSDNRGSFTELIKTINCGQFSVNISKPGITKGQHWHNSKWEIFIVVSGHGLIQERKIDTEEIIEFEVSGEKIEAVYMLPGYTHNIINLSDTENLVTLMWANEQFTSESPDTFSEIV